jgi:hypothetical protein
MAWYDEASDFCQALLGAAFGGDDDEGGGSRWGNADRPYETLVERARKQALETII